MAGFPHRLPPRPFLLQSRALWVLVTSSGLLRIISSPSLAVGGLSGSPLALYLAWRALLPQNLYPPRLPPPAPWCLLYTWVEHLLYHGLSSFNQRQPLDR